MDTREMKDPLVSVLICSYNAENFIEATMRSVINQTYRNMEILVLDNNSVDKTAEVLDQMAKEDGRLRIYRADVNLGAYGGLNYLLERTAGKYVAINDHDDIWHEDKIRKQVEFLENNKDYVGSGTAMVNYYEKYDLFLLRRQPRQARGAWHPSLVFRNTGKRYDTSIKIAADFYFVRHVLCRNGKFIHNLEEPLLLRKIMADQTNLSSRWIEFKNLKEIVTARLAAKDKIPMLCRLVLTHGVVDRLILRLLLRKDVLSTVAMEKDPVLRRYLAH